MGRQIRSRGRGQIHPCIGSVGCTRATLTYPNRSGEIRWIEIRQSRAITGEGSRLHASVDAELGRTYSSRAGR